MAAADRLVWIDLEMTGLNPRADEIVEIACIVTEADLTELDSGISLVVKPSDDPLATMDEVVVRMHTDSGLLDEIPDGIALADAEAQVLEYVRQHIPEARKAPLAGSSVYVDRGFLSAYMPDLDAHLHYRLVDVSSIEGARASLVPPRLLRDPGEEREPSRTRRHPGVDCRTALLPRCDLRAASRPGLAYGPGARPERTSSTTRPAACRRL